MLVWYPMSASIAAQSIDELGGSASVLVRQRDDHARLNELLRQIRSTSGDDQDEAIMRMCRLAFTHAFAEEAVLWPALRRSLPDGEQLTLEVEREHQEINETVAALDRSRHGDPGRDELIERAIALLDQDVREEEDTLFPRLQATLGPRELQRLGRMWEIVRRTAPTRPHPVVARRPPGNVLAALPLSAIDRSRDVLDRIVRRGPPPLASASRAFSRALAGVAGAVEHVPPLTRGEDPSTNSGRTEREH
jgi:hemerythrin superfamily protein